MTTISNGGDNIFRGKKPEDRLIVGTVEGVFVLEREPEKWRVAVHALEGCSVSSVTQLESGTLLAAMHGQGVARSTDGGKSWEWSCTGLPHYDLWAARSGRLKGRDVALVGSMPAHLMISEDDGRSWRELPALRDAPSLPHWTFPPPPHLSHVKDIAIHGDRLYVGIEIGALLMSEDFGRSFQELPVDKDPTECDIHRLQIDPTNPQRMLAAVGLVGIMRSVDGGKTWARNPVLPKLEYPDAFVMHPDQPNLLFMGVGVGWPPTWYKNRRAQGKIARSRDGGATWERLLGGLPDGQRALFSALSLHVHDQGFDLFAADTDGQIFESRDGGDHWTIIADIGPVSKGEFFRGLAKGRQRMAGVDDVVVNPSAAVRFADADY